MTFEHPLTVHFDEADAAGILFFSRHLTYAHRTIEAFCRHSGIGWENWFWSKEWGVPLRHIEASYQHPLRPGKDYLARLMVAKLGESSVSFEIKIYQQDRLCTEIKTTHVFVDLKEEKKRPIPPFIRERLEAYLSQ